MPFPPTVSQDGRVFFPPLTNSKAHQAVGEEARSQKGGPQSDIELLRDLRLHPHEQAGRKMEVRPGDAHHPRCRDSHLLLDLFQNVGHLAKEILHEEETEVTTSWRACQSHRHTQKGTGEIRSPRSLEPGGPTHPLLGLRLSDLKLSSLDVRGQMMLSSGFLGMLSPDF